MPRRRAMCDAQDARSIRGANNVPPEPLARSSVTNPFTIDGFVPRVVGTPPSGTLLPRLGPSDRRLRHRRLRDRRLRHRRLCHRGRTGVDSLTPSERGVAEMAAEGRRNVEIAQALLVTRRTVEGHLAAADRKLDIGSRRQLPEVLARSG